MLSSEQFIEAMALYRDWLESKGIAKITAKTYRNVVAKYARIWLNEGSLTAEEVYHHEMTLAQSSRNAFRTSWRRFIEFLSENELPAPPTSDVLRDEEGDDAMLTIGSVANYLSTRMKKRPMLLDIVWGDVTIEPQYTAIRHGGSVYSYYGATASAALRSLCFAVHKQNVPGSDWKLFAAHPRSCVSMSVVRLSRLMRAAPTYMLDEDRIDGIDTDLMLDIREALGRGQTVEELRALVRSGRPLVIEQKAKVAEPAPKPERIPVDVTGTAAILDAPPPRPAGLKPKPDFEAFMARSVRPRMQPKE